MNGLPWTEHQLAQMRKLYPHKPTAEVARRLGRTPLAIYQAADKLGLRKTAEYLASPDSRLTNAFSKKAENHAHAVSLFFMFYNYCRPHQTLTKAAKGIKTTPAMASGLTDHVWTVEGDKGYCSEKCRAADSEEAAAQ